MSPSERNEIAVLAQSPLVTPPIPTVEIARASDQQDAPKLVSGLAYNLFNAANSLAAVINATELIQSWRTTLDAEYQRLGRLRAATSPFSVDHTNETVFHLASIYRTMMLVVAALFIGGIAILLNTISAAISSSGEIADLTNAPVRAAAWAFLPIAGMMVGHMAHYLAEKDTTKTMITWSLLGVAAVCIFGWSIAFVEAFPLGAEAASGNLFEEQAQPIFAPMKWLMAFQLFGEVAFGGLVGIVLERISTRGKKTVVIASAQHDEIDQRQRDLLQDRSDADRLLGGLQDYQRRFDNSAAAYAASCGALLIDMQNQLSTVRGAALSSLIAKYAPDMKEVEHV